VDRGAELLQRLSQGWELQTVGVGDGSKVFLVELPAQNLLAGNLEVEEQHRCGENQDYRRSNHGLSPTIRISRGLGRSRNLAVENQNRGRVQNERLHKAKPKTTSH